MENSPLVSILMPVYNSFDFVRSENKRFITKALDSLLAQTYANFELIILDNQSTDQTVEICEKYAKNDKRIRLIIDTEKRYPEGGISQASTFARGEFCMIANDDDLWDPRYIETLVAYHISHPGIDLAYTNGNFVDVNGNDIGKISTSNKHVYIDEHSPLSNLSRYLINRNPIPISFGLFKKSSFAELMPYEDFDILKANVDNLLIAKLFLQKQKVDFIDKNLFRYRVKGRILNPKKVSDMPGLDRKDLIGFYYFRHQFFFHDKIISTFLREYNPTQEQSDFMEAVSLHSLLKHSYRLNYWLEKQYKENPGDKILHEISENFSSIVKKNLNDFPSIGYHSDDSKNNIRFEPVLNLNLLKINKASLNELGMLMEKYDDEDIIISDLKKLIADKRNIIGEKINKITSRLENIPEILTKEPLPAIVSDKPRISVITASYNLAPFVEETMRSVANQDCNSFEHIVIDGGSTDGSLELLKKYPNIILVSEKDNGYPDALWKGIRLAKGDHILQCAISDAYAATDWLKKCLDTLDKNKDVSLVWGFPGRLTEDSKLNGIARYEFVYDEAPQKEKMFNHFLKTNSFFPEGNLCVKKSVMLKCYPSVKECSTENILDWREFSYRFNSLGYLSLHIPMHANFGRTHGNQLCEKLNDSGDLKKKRKNYERKVRNYRLKLLAGLVEHKFVDSNGATLDIKFNKNNFLREYLIYRSEKIFKIDKRYLQPEKYLKFLKKKLIALKNKVTK